MKDYLQTQTKCRKIEHSLKVDSSGAMHKMAPLMAKGLIK